LKLRNKLLVLGFLVLALIPLLMMTSLVGQKGTFYDVANNKNIDVNKFVDMSSKEAEILIESLSKEDEKAFEGAPVSIKKIKEALELEKMTYSRNTEEMALKSIYLTDCYDYDFRDRAYEHEDHDRGKLKRIDSKIKSYEDEEYRYRVPWQVMVTIDFLLDKDLIGYSTVALQSHYKYAYTSGHKPHFTSPIKTTDRAYIEISNHTLEKNNNMYISYDSDYNLNESAGNYTTYYREDKEVVVVREYDYEKGEGYELDDKEKIVSRVVKIKEPVSLLQEIETPFKSVTFQYDKNIIEDELVDRSRSVKVHRNKDREITGKTVTTTSKYVTVSEIKEPSEVQLKDTEKYSSFLESIGLGGREEDVLQFSSLNIGGTDAVTELLSVSESSLMVISDMYFSGLSYIDLELTPSELAAPIPRFYQNDERWSKLPYGNSTIGSGGCGPTSTAMILTGLTKKVVSPVEMAYLSAGNGYKVKEGTSWGFFSFAAKKYGLSVKQVGPSDYDEVMEALQNGKPVIATVGPGHFTSDGHIIVLVAIDEEGIIVNDPYDPKNNKNRSWDPRIVINEASQYFIFSTQDMEVS